MFESEEEPRPKRVLVQSYQDKGTGVSPFNSTQKQIKKNLQRLQVSPRLMTSQQRAGLSAGRGSFMDPVFEERKIRTEELSEPKSLCVTEREAGTDG